MDELGIHQLPSAEGWDGGLISGLQSPFGVMLGFKIIESSLGRAVIAVDITPHHLNRSGYINGGVLLSLMDSACSFAGLWCSVPGNTRQCVTLSLTTSFIAAAKSGLVRAVAQTRGGGKQIFTASCDILDADNRLLATGQGSFRYLKGSGDVAGFPAAKLFE